MIIRLKGATFTTNIGTLDSWSIKYTTTNGSVTKKSGALSIKKDDTDGEILVFEFDTAKYTYKSGTIMSNGVSAGTISVSGNTITVNVNAGTTLSGKVEINFVMEAIGGEEPGTTNYTFTINPTPTSATVTLSATGYSTVSGTGSKSITVANGTNVNWSVSASGYTTRTGSWTISGGNKTENITLTAASGGGSSGTIDLTTLSSVKTSDVTYNTSTHTFAGSATGNIVSDKLAKQLFVVTEPLTAGMELEVAVIDNQKKFGVIGLNSVNTLESIKETACYNQSIMATPVNLYFDPSNNGTIMSFESADTSLNKPVCTGAGAAISRDNSETYTIIFKRATDGTITVWQKDKGQIIPAADSPTASNPHTITTQWNSLNSEPNVYLCGHGAGKYISYQINYFGKLR